MKFFKEYLEVNPNDKVHFQAFNKYESEHNNNIDDIDSEEKFQHFCTWLKNNYASGSAYRKRACAKRYIEFLNDKLGRETFSFKNINIASNRYEDKDYKKVCCPFIFYDQLMSYVEEKISIYIRDNIDSDEDKNLAWSGYLQTQVLFTLLWNGFHINSIPNIKLSDINFDDRTILGKSINKGWNYIEDLYNQKSYYVYVGNGYITEKTYYNSRYLFKHRSSKRSDQITRGEIRSLLNNFFITQCNGEEMHSSEIMYAGAMSSFFKTDAAYTSTVAVSEDLKNFISGYCYGYISIPSKRELYEHYELYKNNLLKYLVSKNNIKAIL